MADLTGVRHCLTTGSIVDLAPEPGDFYVYRLLRADGSAFYVGKGGSGRGTQARLNEHESRARRGCRCHRCNVIRKVWRNGGTITMQIVFRSADEQVTLDREVEYIASTPGLVNKTAGGTGVSGWRHTPEARAKMSLKGRGRRQPEHVKRLLRAINTGAVRSKATCRRISAAKRGKPGHVKSHEECEKISKAQRGPLNHAAQLNWPIVRRIRSLHRKGLTVVAISRQLDVPYGNTWKIVQHLSWKE